MGKAADEEAPKNILDSVLLRWFRHIHPRHIGYRSPHTGYAAVVDEIEFEHANLDDARLRQAVYGSLTDMMGGKAAVRLIGLLGRRLPRPTSNILAAITPHAFRWLVGPMERTRRDEILVKKCRFLAETSPEICHRICREPTQRFFTDALSVPASLHPHYESGSCQITFLAISRSPRDPQGEHP